METAIRMERGSEESTVAIEKTEPGKRIVELFADFNGDYVPAEMDWGKPAGKEIW